MKTRMVVEALALVLLATSPADAFRLPFNRRVVQRAIEASKPTSASGSPFSRALSGFGLSTRDVTSGNTTVGNIANSQYVANITIGGGNYNVILDTGRYAFCVRIFGYGIVRLISMGFAVARTCGLQARPQPQRTLELPYNFPTPLGMRPVPFTSYDHFM